MTLHDGVASQHKRATVLQALLVVGLVADAAGALTGVAQHALLSRMAEGAQVAEAAVAANDLAYGLVGIGQTVVAIATVVAWLVWMHRAYGNLRLMGCGHSRYGPGWAVGWWFVPVLNLFRPYQLTKEMWRRSASGNAVEDVSGSASPDLLGLWWFAWILSNLLGQVVFRYSLRAQSLHDLRTATAFGVGLDVLGVATTILAILVVRNVDRLQRDAPAAAASDGPEPIAP